MANAPPFVAGPSRRLAAGFIDSVVLLLFVILALAIVSQAGNSSDYVEIILITYAIYHAACFSLFHGVSPGLGLLDMRLVSAGGGELSTFQAFGRAIFRPALLYAFGWSALYFADSPSVLFSMIAMPLCLELGMMFTLPSRQTLSDIVARTLVVNIPPPQPHRAPAGPMYSATDAEFGVRPRKLKRVMSIPCDTIRAFA